MSDDGTIRRTDMYFIQVEAEEGRKIDRQNREEAGFAATSQGAF